MKITSKQAAELLKIKEDTLRKWRVYGSGPAFTKGPKNQVSYTKADVLKWIKENTVKKKAGYVTKAYKER